MRKQSYRFGRLQLAVMAVVLLFGFAVAQPAEANSCFGSIILPSNQSSAVCGSSLAVSVPTFIGFGTGTASATDQVTLGVLHSMTNAFASVPTLTAFASGASVSQIATGANNNTFNFNDLVISGPVGTVGTTLTVSFNLDISGALTAQSTGSNMLAVSVVGVTYQLGGTSGQGAMQATNGGGFSSSGILQGIVANQGTVPNTIIRTGVATVTVGTPFSFTLGLQEGSIAGPTNFCNGGCVGTASAISNFANTFGLPTTGPVANLPAGYTLSSASGLIVNNQFGTPAPTPEPSTLLLFGSGMLAMAGAARRRLFC